MRTGGADRTSRDDPSREDGTTGHPRPSRRSVRSGPPRNLHPDGRIARGERTRRALVDAVVALIDERGEAPSSREAARRAGVSVRVLFRHFHGIEGLLAPAVARQAERHRSQLFEIPPGLLPSVRIEAVCRQRRLYFEVMAPVLRIAQARAHAVAGLDDLLADDSAVSRSQLARTFGPELADRGAAAAELLDALVLATAWDAWRSLRGPGARSAAQSERVMAFTVGRLLNG